MEYDSESDSYICKNKKNLTVDHIRHSKTKTGYESEKTIYKCEDCSGCPYKSDCIKGNNCKTPLEERTKTLMEANCQCNFHFIIENSNKNGIESHQPLVFGQSGGQKESA